MAVDLSALTPAYSSTPAPLGRPGGPGLWRDKARKLPDYIENVAKGIMQGGEADKSRAIATAIAAVKRWAAGGGKVSPEVRAAAAKALAEWTALKASAHAHANEGGAVVSLTWCGQAVDLSSVDLGGSYIAPHVPAGSPQGGQFGTTSGKGGKGANSGGTAGKTPAQQHAAHIAHLQHLAATGQATPAQRQELAGLLKALNAKPGTAPKPGTAAATEAAAAAAIAAHPLPNAPAKPKAAAKPKAKKAAVKPKAAAKAAGTPAVKAPGKVPVPAPVKVSGTPVQRKAALHAQANADRVKAAGIEQQITSLDKVIAAQVKATAATKAGAKVKPTAAAKAKAALAKAAPKKAGSAATKSPARKAATLAQNRATVKTLTGKAKALRAQAGALDAQANAIKLSGDGRFLDLAFTEALTVPGPDARRLVLPPAERVPPGQPEGGQYAPKPPVLTRHDTPAQAAAVINSMNAAQRAQVRATILCPPFHAWTAGDRLEAAR